MGIYSGEASQTAAGLAGLQVRRAARIAAVAHRGQVVVLAPAAGLLRDWLPPGVGPKDLGPRRLNGMGRPEQIFQLQAEGVSAALRCGRWATRRC